MIKWKCNEEKIGWRISAVLPLENGVRIETDVVIPRDLMSPAQAWECIANIQHVINQRRIEHEAQHV